jgi:hypothetical protein
MVSNGIVMFGSQRNVQMTARVGRGTAWRHVRRVGTRGLENCIIFLGTVFCISSSSRSNVVRTRRVEIVGLMCVNNWARVVKGVKGRGLEVQRKARTMLVIVGGH